MATYHHQWIYLVDALGDAQEFVNGARTAAYLEEAAAIEGVDIDNVLALGGCEAYAMKPCQIESDGTVTQWAAMGFSTVDAPDEPAPWWDGVTGSVSTEALGMWIEEWTGLDGAHHTRSVKPVGSRPQGSRFGPMAAQHRVWKINMVLFGRSERGLEYLFRWLEHTLLASCDTCAETSMWIRLTCPETYEPEDGIVLARNVALLEGPTWEDEPLPGAGCVLRRVSFTLGVGDPCLYSPTVALPVFGTLNVVSEIQNNPAFMPFPVSAWPVKCRPDCDTIGGNGRLSIAMPTISVGTQSPIVHIRTDANGGLPEMRISGLEDLTGVGANTCSARTVGQICTARLPANAELLIDFGRHEVQYRDSTTGGWVPGWAFITPNEGVARRWISFGCWPSYVAIEMNSLCYEYNGGSIYDLDGELMTFTQTPEIKAWAQRRVGCV